MTCDYCKQNLVVADNEMISAIDSTDVFAKQTLVCVNPRCEIYSGRDLTRPDHVAKTVENKVN